MSEQPPSYQPPPPPSGPPPSGPPSGPRRRDRRRSRPRIPPPSYQPPSYQPPAYQAQPSYAVVGAVPNNSKAVPALVLGILSLVCCPIAGPVAIWFGRSSMAEIDASGGTQGGRGMGLAGFILGIIGSVYALLIILWFIFVILLAVGSAGIHNTTP